jgi:hypothetical protein
LSENKDDLELEALQRQLDDAFNSTRPRRGFEDELWLRMQARRPFGARVREAFGSVVAGFRAAPAVPIGAVAVLLVVVIGAGVLLSSGLRPGGESRALSQGAAQAPDHLALGAAGRLPTPALHPGLVDKATQNGGAYAAEPAPSAPSNLYFGPATLRWTGQLPGELPAQAPVYSYTEPGPNLIDPFLTSLGATSHEATAPGFLGTYSGTDLTVSVRGTVAQLPREPYFVLTSSNGAGATGSDPQTVAMNFLSYYGLFPDWSVTVTVQQAGQQTRVLFPRTFEFANGNPSFVDWNGEATGIEVDLVGNQVRTVTGPLPLILGSTSYRLISNVDAVRTVLASAPASQQGIQPVPTVNLSSVELVYALAVANGQGFYEPCYLFSGTFSYNGQTYTKRVLVPLVDPSLRS